VRVQLDNAVDPAEERAREKARRQAERAEAQRRTEGSVAKLFELYIDSLDGRRSARDVRNYYARHIKGTLGKRLAADVTEGDVMDVLTPLVEEGKHASAKNLRVYLRAAFEFGRTLKTNLRYRRRASDFGITFNPVALVPAKAVRPPRGATNGGRHLTRDEVRALWPLLEQQLPTDAALATKLLLSTGQRVEEVWHARLAEFDREAGLWTIPGTRRKNGVDHVVPVEEFHWELIDRLRKARTRESVLLIPPPQYANVRKGDGKALRRELDADTPRDHHGLTRAVARMLKRLADDDDLPTIAHFSPRDIRRTWKTLAGEIGLSKEIRDRLQGHALTDISSQAYDRYDYLAEKRAAMQGWVAFLEGLTRGSADVVPLKGRHQPAS
jgi:integrase